MIRRYTPFACFAVAAAMAFSAAAQDAIPWATDLQKALAKAAQEKKYVFVEVYADWCGPCQHMEKTTWQDPKVIATLANDYVPLKIDADKDPATASQYGVESLPTMMLLTAEGTPFAQRLGYMSANSVMEFLDESSQLEAKIDELKKSVEASPDDVESVLELAKLQLLFDRTDESIALLQRSADRLGQDASSDTRARFAYQLGLAQLVHEDYDKGLTQLETFLTTYKDHELAPIATQMYGIGTVELARDHVESGREDQARSLLAKLSASDEPYLNELAKSSIAMLDAIKEKQQELQSSPEVAP